jgi:hypothetical protein
MAADKKTETKHTHCPYCSEEIAAMNLPICSACKVEIFYCPECKEPVKRNLDKCPKCGAKMKKEK